MFKKSLFRRQIDACNILQADIRCTNILASFKRRLNSVDLSTFLNGSAYRIECTVGLMAKYEAYTPKLILLHCISHATYYIQARYFT